MMGSCRKRQCFYFQINIYIIKRNYIITNTHPVGRYSFQASGLGNDVNNDLAEVPYLSTLLKVYRLKSSSIISRYRGRC